MAGKFLELDYTRSDGFTLRVRPENLRLVPEPARGHLRAANKELLLALRSFVDQAINRMEPQEESREGRRPRRVRVRGSQEPQPADQGRA